MHDQAKRIRNVALLGHRGSGKTSLNEALLFEAGAINRLGSVADGTTVSDSAADEKAREMSIQASLSSFRWQDRKINLIDTPGDPSFVCDALASLRAADGAVFVVNGVMGVEVSTDCLEVKHRGKPAFGGQPDFAAILALDRRNEGQAEGGVHLLLGGRGEHHVLGDDGPGAPGGPRGRSRGHGDLGRLGRRVPAFGVGASDGGGLVWR